MSVQENVEYGLRVKRVARGEPPWSYCSASCPSTSRNG